MNMKMCSTYYFLLIFSFLAAQIAGIILRRISFTMLVQYGQLTYMYPLFNKNQAASNFLSPELEVT